MVNTIANIREILCKEPCMEVWGEIVEQLRPWRGTPEQEMALDYLQGHLSSWPDELRVAPILWLERLIDGKSEPRLKLIRSVEVPSELMRGLPRRDHEKLKESGFLILRHLSDFSAFQWSKLQHMQWLSNLTQEFINNFYYVVGDFFADLIVTFDIFDTTDNWAFEELISKAVPAQRTKRKIETCHFQEWETLDLQCFEQFLSRNLMGYIDNDGGMWDIKDVFSKADLNACIALADDWLEHIERAMEEKPFSCCRVELLFDEWSPRKWHNGLLMKGHTKTAFLAGWYVDGSW